jgi:nitroimidazol reductase NimA-like FMN-containing flavoprotein (pyridoxamine 5'-phosphate oxidase superfamily)
LETRLSTEPKALPLDAPADYPFPKSDEGLLPWSNVLAQLEQSRIYWLATVRPDGRPHVAPLWGGWVDNALYFEGSPQTRWARNLAVNPAASINLESGIDVVIAEGTVSFFPLSDELRSRLIDLWSVKYGQYGPQPDTEAMFRFVPRTVRAFGESLQDGARWVLNP